MKNTFLLTMVALLITLLLPEHSYANDKIQLPEWFFNPDIENGVAASHCINATSNLSITKAKAYALAISSLASQIEVSIDAVEELKLMKTNDNDIVKFKSEAVASVRQLVSGAKVIKEAKAIVGNEEHFCILVGLSNSNYKKALKNSILKSKSQEMLLAAFNHKLVKKK
jgi:hypothetical protein